MNIPHSSQTNFCDRSEIRAGHESPENTCFISLFVASVRRQIQRTVFSNESFSNRLKKFQHSFPVRTDIIQQICYMTVRLWTARLQKASSADKTVTVLL